MFILLPRNYKCNISTFFITVKIIKTFYQKHSIRSHFEWHHASFCCFAIFAVRYVWHNIISIYTGDVKHCSLTHSIPSGLYSVALRWNLHIWQSLMRLHWEI